jgi:hypothetical protein
MHRVFDLGKAVVPDDALDRLRAPEDGEQRHPEPVAFEIKQLLNDDPEKKEDKNWKHSTKERLDRSPDWLNNPRDPAEYE